MGRLGTIQRSLVDTVEQVFARSRAIWVGCDWPTSFGKSGIDLNGMTSAQALLMSRATSGEEAADWRAAVHWLRMIEADAEAAEEGARWAVQHVLCGDLEAAGREAQAAVDLESRYHPRPVWAQLRDVLESRRSVSPDHMSESRRMP